MGSVGLDVRLASWFYTRDSTIEGRRVVAVDGKTMRGARTNENPAPRLLSALDQVTGTVLTQTRAEGSTIVKAVEVPKWVDFSAAGQVIQVWRTRTTKGRKSTSRTAVAGG